ncbi:MAG: stage IV sporulation protein A, partial [Lachnospiraceae bacterium]|nr:stage IV sporulation protein A [Lachnospiraceae bacterium]
MEKQRIYEDIKERTNGDIYVGVVGPVRTGKSTFIKNFMDLLVIPNISNSYQKERTRDELPQSAAGKTVMTTEPKFIPNEAVEITLDGNLKLKTRLVDCVGYLVNNALGYMENDVPRMIKTPWSKEEMPFETAAEIGTKKVIEEHSTIGILVTTDGSITEIPREDYVVAEERVVGELKQLNKPFVIVLNTKSPRSDAAVALASELSEKYNTSVVPTDCSKLSAEDVNNIFGTILYEFPIETININFPKWVEGLDFDTPLKSELFKEIKDAFKGIKLVREINSSLEKIQATDIITKSNVNAINLGTGEVHVNIELKDELFYEVLSEISGIEVKNETDLFLSITQMAKVKKEYDKISYALDEVKRTGYGIVTPGMEELVLEEPEMVKQGSRFGVRLKAKAPSIHMIRADIETEVSPIVGSEKQSEELVTYLLEEFENDPIKI